MSEKKMLKKDSKHEGNSKVGGANQELNGNVLG